MANKSLERQQIEFLYDVPFAVCRCADHFLYVCLGVCVCLLAFGTVCEMIFHLAFWPNAAAADAGVAICFSPVEQPAKPLATNFFYQSQLIMTECVCVDVAFK